jgi:hypothetical protein
MVAIALYYWRLAGLSFCVHGSTLPGEARACQVDLVRSGQERSQASTVRRDRPLRAPVWGVTPARERCPTFGLKRGQGVATATLWPILGPPGRSRIRPKMSPFLNVTLSPCENVTLSPRIPGRELLQGQNRAIPGPELGPELPQERMRGRSLGGAALFREHLSEFPNARRIFAAIKRRLEDLPGQLAPLPRSLVPALGSG